MVVRHRRIPYVILGAVFALWCFPRVASAKVPATFSEGMASLNFDDGWKNFYTNALPLLQKAKVKATLYPVSGYVKERRKQFMTAALLRAVEAQGHEIGAHTQYHVLLTKVTRQRADREIRQSRQDLEDLGVRSVTTFAYPYGVYSRRLRGVVRETGYSGARISSCGLNSPRSDRLLLKTCAVSRKMKVARLKSWIDDAVREKRWLIITFHDVQKKPRRYGTTPNVLEEILKYLKQKRVRVVTNSQGLQIINEIRLTN